MELLTWTGTVGAVLNPIFLAVVAVLAVAIVLQFVTSIVSSPGRTSVNPDGTLSVDRGPQELAGMGVRYSFFALVAVAVAYLLIGVLTPIETSGIIGELSSRLLSVWIALIVTFVLSIRYKRRLGLYGKLFDNPIGMVGFGLVMFWVYVAMSGWFLPDWIFTQDPLAQISGMKNKVPGTPIRGEQAAWYLLGGDNLARDVWSRLVTGSQIVLSIAPVATAFAFMVGITLGLPAGYFGGWFDTGLSFLANLVLAFPVILLFYLLVTPEIRETGVVTWVAAILFIFPVIFFWVLMYSRYRVARRVLNTVAAPVVIIMLMFYFGTVFEMDPFVGIWTTVMGHLNQGNQFGDWMAQTWARHEPLVSLGLGPERLNIFVSVVFVNSPTIFRIVRGLTLDIKTRDYVAAAQTRGEGPWYIMLWEILPNARGPLIVDFCLRIGYTTILIGTLGFFGLGLGSESPDWGSTINEGRKLLSIYVHPALPPALALMSLVLGLNLLADGLREESLKD